MERLNNPEIIKTIQHLQQQKQLISKGSTGKNEFDGYQKEELNTQAQNRSCQ